MFRVNAGSDQHHWATPRATADTVRLECPAVGLDVWPAVPMPSWQRGSMGERVRRKPGWDGASRASLAQNEHVNGNQETRDGAPSRRCPSRTHACRNHRDCASLPRESVARGLHARRRGRHARRDPHLPLLSKPRVAEGGAGKSYSRPRAMQAMAPSLCKRSPRIQRSLSGPPRILSAQFCVVADPRRSKDNARSQLAVVQRADPGGVAKAAVRLGVITLSAGSLGSAVGFRDCLDVGFEHDSARRVTQ